MHKEKGYLLGLVFLIPLMAAIASVFFFALKPPSNLKELTARDLLKIKNHLLAYAATDEERPGRLPCAGNEEGEAQLFSRNVCPKNFGRLPWKSLDWGGAQNIGYAVAEHFSGDFPPSKTLNPKAPADLNYIDEEGVLHSNLVALLFVPRFEADFETLPQIDLRHPKWLGAVGITKEELLFSAQKAVTQRVLKCFKAHSLRETLPAPAPFAAENFQSHPNARFGRVPEWAENPGLSVMVANFLKEWEALPQDLPLQEVENFNWKKWEESLYAFNSYVAQAFGVYQNLNQVAQKLEKSANTLESTFMRTIADKTENEVGRVSASAQKTILQNAQNVENYYETIRQTLWESGFSFDFSVFLTWEKAKIDFQNLAPLNKTVQSAEMWQALWAWRKANALLRQESNALFLKTQENALLVRKLPTATSKQENAESLYAQSKNVQEVLNKTQKSVVQFKEKETAARKKTMQKNVAEFLSLFQHLKATTQNAQSVLKGEKANRSRILWQSAECDFFNTWWVKDSWQEFVFYQQNAFVLGRGKKEVVVMASGAELPQQNRENQSPEHYFESCNAEDSRANWAENPKAEFCATSQNKTFNDVLAW